MYNGLRQCTVNFVGGKDTMDPYAPPVQPPPVRNPVEMRSTMNDTYRTLPQQEYRKQDDAKQGPLSRTVTLTNPFNPFNKLQYHV